MARGFESKSVQEQWQDAEARAEQRRKRRVTPEEMVATKKREELFLTRTRVERELRETQSERRRESLSAALAHLDGELAKLG